MPKIIAKTLTILALIPVLVLPLAPSAIAIKNYQPISPLQLAQDIDEFFAAGAQGFLVWQYSGSLAGQWFGNDDFSFFQTNNPQDIDYQICQTLKTKANQHSDKFVGVNMWDIGDPKYSQGLIKDHFDYLKNNCGVSVIRTFAKAGGAGGMQKVLDAASQTGIKVIIAVGDYSNGSQGLPKGATPDWYKAGHKTEFTTFAKSIKNAVTDKPALYGLELANEPHCGNGDSTTINDYKQWGQTIGAILRQVTANVGYGQMATANGICDSPTTGGFKDTNNISQITMTSAHYYNSSEKQTALLALQQSKSLGKMFYIGEASYGNNQISSIIDKLLEQPDPGPVPPRLTRGINTGPLPPWDTSFFDLVGGIVKALLSYATADKCPTNYRGTQYHEDIYTESGELPNMIKIPQPNTTILDQVATILQNPTVGFAGVMQTIITSHPPKDYDETIGSYGPGKMFSIEALHYDFYSDSQKNGKPKIRDDFFSFQSGASPRLTPYALIDDQYVDEVICKLAASGPNNPHFESSPENRLFDVVLGYLHPDLEKDFTINLPIDNPKANFVDRTQTEANDRPVPIRISTILCIGAKRDDFVGVNLARCTAKGFGPISPDICSGTPDWLQQPGLEGPIFRTFYPRLRQQVRIFLARERGNAPAKGFLEQCQEQNLSACGQVGAIVVDSDFGDLPKEVRTHVLNKNDGAFSKSQNGKCYACHATIIFLPKMAQATSTLAYTGKMTTPYSVHPDPKTNLPTINTSNYQTGGAGIYNPDRETSVGVDNRDNKAIDYNLKPNRNFGALFSKTVNIKDCSITYETDEEGNLQPVGVCQGQQASELTTNLYLSGEITKFQASLGSFLGHLTPFSVQEETKKAIATATGGTSLSNFLNITTKSHSNDEGLFTSATDYNNQYRHIDKSSRQLVSPTTISYGKSFAPELETQQLLFTPHAWQQPQEMSF